MGKRPMKVRAGQIVLISPGKISVINPDEVPDVGALGEVRKMSEAAPYRVVWAMFSDKGKADVAIRTVKSSRDFLKRMGL